MGSQHLTRGDAADQNPKPAVFSPGAPRQTVSGRLSDRKTPHWQKIPDAPNAFLPYSPLSYSALLCFALPCPARLFSDRHSCLLPVLPGTTLLSATGTSPAAIAISYRSANAEHGKQPPRWSIPSRDPVCSTISQSRPNRTALLANLNPGGNRSRRCESKAT